MDIQSTSGGGREARNLFLRRRWAQQEGKFDTSSKRLAEQKSTKHFTREGSVSICGFAVDLVRIAEEAVETGS